MAHPMGRTGLGKSVMVTFRLEKEVFDRLKKNHPNVSEYVRQRMTYDITRSHKKRKK